MKEYAGADCNIKRYTLSDEQVRPLGKKDVALLTYKVAVEGTCGGQKVPAKWWAASIYVRGGDTWKLAFHAEAAIVDPETASAQSKDKHEAPMMDEANSAAEDAGTRVLVANEKNLWEAWKDHDANKIEHLTTRDISFIDIFGNHFATKAAAVKDWTGNGCNVRSVSITNAAATMPSPTVGILTFDGSADGTCFGQKVEPIWGTSVYVKAGGAWEWTFGINLPADR